MKKLLALIILALSFNLLADGAYNTAIRTDSIFSKTDTDFVIGGYDVVAYFTQNAALQGSEEFEYQWSDGRWLFSSAEHLQLFKADPGKYAPQYGGYCAWAVAKDNHAEIFPQKFAIIDGKLYLNYNTKIQNKWSKDPTKYIAKANRNWPGVLDEILED